MDEIGSNVGSDKKLALTDWLITSLCLLGTYWIHKVTYLSWDMAWHAIAAERLLAGGSYLVNLFDTNAPTVFTYFVPLIWLKRLLASSWSPQSITLYVLATTAPLLALCYSLVNSAFAKNELFVKRFFYFSIVFIFLLLPAFNFGQREIVLIAFYLPYFLYLLFSTVSPKAFQTKKSIGYLAAILGAFGITQNIFYLCIPVFIDIYRYLKIKKFTEIQLTFYAGILLIIALVTWLYPEYIKQIIPMVLRYESGFNWPFITLILERLCFMSLLTILMVVVNYKRLYKSDDIIFCFIAAVCSLLIYFFELKLWYYHLYPALTFVFIILALFIIKYYQATVSQQPSLAQINLFSLSVATGIAATIIAIIIQFATDEITLFRDPTHIDNRWLTYSRQNFKNSTVFALTMKLGTSYIMPIYSNANIKVVSPWSNPWMIPYIITQRDHTNSQTLRFERDILIFQRLVTNALADKKPDFIIVEEPTKFLLYRNKQFNCIDFFSEDKRFAELFKQYKKYGSFYIFTIFKKID